MGLAQSVAVTEAHALGLAFFGAASKRVEPSTKKAQDQDVVVIPVDGTAHAEAAFDCKFSTTFLFLTLYIDLRLLKGHHLQHSHLECTSGHNIDLLK